MKQYFRKYFLTITIGLLFLFCLHCPLFALNSKQINPSQHPGSIAWWQQTHTSGVSNISAFMPRNASVTPPGTQAISKEIGDEKTFWVWDLSVMPPGFLEVPATLKAIGDSCYIFVENAQWNASVFDDAVAAILDRFENQTPEGSLHPNRGIYENDVSYFGEAPDALDNDPHIYILLAELPGYEKRGTFYEFDGYFNVFDQYSDDYAMEEWAQHSNEVEILYINPTLRDPASDYNMAVIAHEFQHMIHWNFDVDEESWINESLSEAAMMVNGYYTDIEFIQYFLQQPDKTLAELEHVDYGQMFLWAAYMLDHFPAELLKKIVVEEENGVTGFSKALAELGYSIPFSAIFQRFAIANALDMEEIDDGIYAYSSLDLSEYSIGFTDRIMRYPGRVRDSVNSYAADYISLENLPAGGLSLYLDANRAENMGFFLLKYLQNGEVEVERISANDSSSFFVEVPNAEKDYKSITAVVIGLEGSNFKYTLEADSLSGCGIAAVPALFPTLLCMLPLGLLALRRRKL